MMNALTIKRIGPAIMLAAALVLAAGTPAPAGASANQDEQVQGDGRAVVSVPSVQATIVLKKHAWLITAAGDRYAVNQGTLIVGPDKRQVSLGDMRVPCEATIWFQQDRTVRRVHRIRITRISDGAKTGFSKEMPE
jgi:hypothetical protein